MTVWPSVVQIFGNILHVPVLGHCLIFGAPPFISSLKKMRTVSCFFLLNSCTCVNELVFAKIDEKMLHQW